jgi:hypothetical protein
MWHLQASAVPAEVLKPIECRGDIESCRKGEDPQLEPVDVQLSRRGARFQVLQLGELVAEGEQYFAKPSMCGARATGEQNAENDD